MTPAEIIELLNADIALSRKTADQFLTYFAFSLLGLLVVVTLYVLPGVAATVLPYFKTNFVRNETKRVIHEVMWEQHYKKPFERLSSSAYDEKRKAGKLTAAEIEAEAIRPLDDDKEFLELLEWIAKFQSQNERLEAIIKIVPAIFAALAAGLLLTYRFHAKEAGDLLREKYKILAAFEAGRSNEKASDSEFKFPSIDGDA